MRTRFFVGVLLACAGAVAVAQPAAEGVEFSPVAQRAIEAPYLSEDERDDLRVFHGVWDESDLATSAQAARAALISGAWDHDALDDETVPVEDRAEAMLARGDLRRAVGVLSAGDRTLRGQRILAEAYEGLGMLRQADDASARALEAVSRGASLTPGEIVDVVRTMRVRSRIHGLPAQDYQRMMGLLAKARELDPLYWPAALEEARMLHAKDNFSEAREAVGEALALCPRSLGALELLAQMSVQSFNFDQTDAVTNVMDEAVGGESASAEAALWRAHAMLRQNDPDLAEELLAPVLERYPRHRDLVAASCAIAAVRYELAETERALAGFDELSPGSPLALFTAGSAMSENRQYGYAAELLERAVERAPNWPPPIVALGLLHVQAADDAAAERWLSRAVDLDPFQRRARNSLEMIEGLAAFDTIESEHFIVRYKPGVDRVMAEEMLPVLERIHTRVAGEFDHEPSRKTFIELMPDHEWFAVRITGMPAVHTIAAATGPLIAMEAPKVGPKHSGVYDWPRVVQHEYAHTITLSRTNNRIPHWFTEAAAVNVEDAPRDYNTWRLLAGALQADELFDMREINIAFVRPKKPTDRGQAYAQGAWMYEYLKKTHGERAPLDLMDLYAQGLREKEAMERALGVTRDEFYEGFIEWAREDAARHGMLVEPSVERLHEEVGLEEFDADAVHALLESYPEHPDVLHAAWTLVLQASGGEVTDEVAAFLERYIAARPVDPEPHRVLARHYLEQGTREADALAVEHLAYLDAREQKTPVFAVERAKRLAALGRLDEAMDSAERAVRLSPFDADHRELAATAALRLGDWATAERHIAALVEIEPEREIHQLRLRKVRERREATQG